MSFPSRREWTTLHCLGRRYDITLSRYSCNESNLTRGRKWTAPPSWFASTACSFMLAVLTKREHWMILYINWLSPKKVTEHFIRRPPIKWILLLNIITILFDCWILWPKKNADPWLWPKLWEVGVTRYHCKYGLWLYARCAREKGTLDASLH